MKNSVGFVTSWMNDENSPQPMQKISNETNSSQNIQSGLTPAHLELKARIKGVEIVMQGVEFAKKSVKKRKEFMDEFKWLVALDAQLGA